MKLGKTENSAWQKEVNKRGKEVMLGIFISSLNLKVFKDSKKRGCI